VAGARPEDTAIIGSGQAVFTEAARLIEGYPHNYFPETGFWVRIGVDCSDTRIRG
jgi:hypothetical protein